MAKLLELGGDDAGFQVLLESNGATYHKEMIRLFAQELQPFTVSAGAVVLHPALQSGVLSTAFTTVTQATDLVALTRVILELEEFKGVYAEIPTAFRQRESLEAAIRTSLADYEQPRVSA